MQKDLQIRYSQGSRLLHGVIAILLILMLSGSFFLSDLPPSYQGLAYMIHKSLGLTILLLILMRIIWIYHTGKPALPPSVPVWERYLSRITQFMLYCCTIIMPLTGWIMTTAANRAPVYFGLFTLPFPGVDTNKAVAAFMNATHKTLAWIFIALICLHIAGALKHYFIDKDGVFARMWPTKR